MYDEQWTKREKETARRAFDLALDRDCSALIEEVRRRASGITEIDDIWRLNKFINERRREMDGKYDYRYSVLILVFIRLVSDGLLTEEDLQGLSDDKLARILFLTRQSR